jgi:DNA relaxase NicK
MHWTELQQLYLPDLGMCWGPACNSLKKLWKSYKIASRTGEVNSDIAWNIRNIQRAMRIPESQFEELEGMDDEETEAQEVEENWGFNSGISEESSELTELDKQLKREEQESQDEEDDW